MLRYTWLLLKLRLRLTWNSVRKWPRVRQLVMAGIALTLLLAAWGLYVAGWGAGLGLREFVGPEFVGRVLPFFFLGVYFFLFTGSFATALGELYLSSDLELLLTAPIPMRAVFTAKFVRSLATNYGLLFFLGLPAFIGLGAGMEFQWPYFPALLLTFLTLPLLPNGLGALAVIVLARYVSARRLREAIAVAGTLSGIVCYLMSQTGTFTQYRGGEDWLASPQAQQAAQQALQVDLFFLPSTWAGQGVAAAGTGQWGWAALNLGLFAVASAVVYVLCLLAAERLYYVGWAGLGAVASRRMPKTRALVGEEDRPRRATRRFPLLPADVWAVMWKDGKYLRRDLRSLIQTALWPLVVIGMIMFQMVLAGEGRGEMPRAFAPLLSLGSGGLILFMIAAMFSRLSLVAVSQEGRSYWLLRTAPLSTMRLLWGKLLVAYLPLLVLGSALMIVFSLLMRAGPLEIAWNLLLIALAGLGISAIALSCGAAFPKFDWDNPQRAVPPLAGLLAFSIYGLYVILIFGLFSIPRFMALLATGWPLGAGAAWDLSALAGWTWAGYVLGLATALVITALAVAAPLILAARRLDQVEV